MINQRADVIKFLEIVKDYLYGDLENFVRLVEFNQTYNEYTEPEGIGSGSMWGPAPSLTTTPETTKYPIQPMSPELSSPILGPFLSTIPHMLAVFSVIDIVGYLVGEGRPGDTQENIKSFFKGLINDVPTLNCLVFLYRHGMSHSFLPKHQVSIAAIPGLPNEVFYLDKNNVVTLNVLYLITLMKSRFESFLEREDLTNRMEFRFKQLQNEDKRKLKKYNLDLNLFAKSITKI